MPAIFPELFFLGTLVAPLILRIVAGVSFLLLARSSWRISPRGRMLAVVEGAFGVAILVGFLTQIVALLGIAIVIARSFFLGKDAPQRSWVESILLIGVLLTLFIMGAGALAIDLPY